MDTGLLDVDAVLDRVSTTLATRFHGVFNTETIHRYVRESYVALHRTARVHQHLPALTEHFTAERLTALAQSQGSLGKTVPEVLFLCVHNSGRSQLAAALMAYHAAGRVHVRSAGSQPAAEISTSVATVIADLLPDGSDTYPKPLTDDVLRAADVIVTMGCGDTCPVLPGKRYLDWNLADPDDADPATVATIRADLDTRVRTLLADLTNQPSPQHP